MSLGPLVVALIFKFVKDEWDIFMCKSVVIAGMVMMNVAMFFLNLIKDQHFNQIEELQEDQQLVDKMGVGFFNTVLWGILIHKIVGTVGMMSMRYYSVFWKDFLHLSPFQTQMINFITILTGSFLSSVFGPFICSAIGESAAVGVIDTISVLLYFAFLAVYSSNYGVDGVNISEGNFIPDNFNRIDS